MDTLLPGLLHVLCFHVLLFISGTYFVSTPSLSLPVPLPEGQAADCLAWTIPVLCQFDATSVELS